MQQEHFHVLLIRAAASHKKKSRQNFQKWGLTEGQPKVLSILKGMEGCQQKELAKECHVEPATMTSLLKNMEQCGLIVKETTQTASGKRANSIYLTVRGRELADKVWDMVDGLETVAFRNFSDEDREMFLRLFAKVADNLEME